MLFKPPFQSQILSKAVDSGFFSTSAGVIDVVQLYLSKAAIALHPLGVLVKIPQNLCSTFEFHRSEDLIAFGRQKTAEAIGQMEKKGLNNGFLKTVL